MWFVALNSTLIGKRARLFDFSAYKYNNEIIERVAIVLSMIVVPVTNSGYTIHFRSSFIASLYISAAFPTAHLSFTILFLYQMCPDHQPERVWSFWYSKPWRVPLWPYCCQKLRKPRCPSSFHEQWPATVGWLPW